MFLSLLLELERDGFCPQPLFECLVAEVPEEHKSKKGKALKQAFSIVLFLHLVICGILSFFFFFLQDSQLSDMPFTFTLTAHGRDAQYIWRTCT